MVAQHEAVVLQMRAASGGIDHDRGELTRRTRSAQVFNQSPGEPVGLLAPAQMMRQRAAAAGDRYHLPTRAASTAAG